MGVHEVIVAEGLGKDFREGFLMRRKTSLESLTFTVPLGTIYGFLGPNGAGKTTTLHLLVGFIAPTRGCALVCGRSPSDPESRRPVGFLPEVFSFDGFSTGSSLLHRFDALAGRPREGREDRVRQALEAMDLLSVASRRIRTYSKGMTQRIGVAQALLGDPDVLILDEPMSGMDPATRYKLRGLLEKRRERGKTTLFSSHILADVEALADRLLILDRGRVVAEGPVDTLRPDPGGSTIVFQDGRPERFDPFLSERKLSRASVVGEPALYRVETAEANTKNALLAKLASEGADIVSVEGRKKGLEELFLQLTGPRAPSTPESSSSEEERT